MEDRPPYSGPLAATFDSAADRYLAARPQYPDALFQAFCRHPAAKKDARILEIGCGAGNATLHMARRGYRVHAIDPGRALLSKAASALTRFPNVCLQGVSFEELECEPGSFDVILAATSFHWVDPSIGIGKAARILRPGGVLAIIDTHHVHGGSCEFFTRVQGCYERFMPGTRRGFRLPAVDEVEVRTFGVGSQPAFSAPHTSLFPSEVTYSTEQYLDLLGTYSHHIALSNGARADLFECIAALIDLEFGGQIVKRYAFSLSVAERSGEALAT